MSKPVFPRVFTAATLFVVVVFFVLVAAVPRTSAQISDPDRERAKVMLNEIKNGIKKNYYDPTFHGVDIDANFKSAEELLKRATSLGQAFGIIAQTVMSLNDSHTFFLPPEQTVSSDYGFEILAVGATCYVSAVKPGSDAEAKGLKPGDKILSLNGVTPLREEIWKINYLYKVLRPQAGFRLTVESADGLRRELAVLAKVRNDKRKLDFTDDGGGNDIFDAIRQEENADHVNRQRYVESGEDLFIWKMPAFNLTERAVDDMVDKARKHKGLVLDLRGNGGGAESTLLRMIGNFFDHDINVGTIKRRNETKPLVAKSRGQNIFTGKLVVLIDSESASASEIFARVIQLEKRGTVIGDRSAGAVMRGRSHDYQMGMDTVVWYGVNVTDADIVMSDGKSLEKSGVIPDTSILPTAQDMTANRDPVLSNAASLIGVFMDPARAGTFFPREWVTK